MQRNEPEGPRCDTCKRPLVPWLEAPMRSAQRPKPGDTLPAKWVCYSALCGKYGLVIRIDPPTATGGSRFA